MTKKLINERNVEDTVLILSENDVVLKKMLRC